MVTQSSPDTSPSAQAGFGDAVPARPTVVITRPAGQSAELLDALAAAGFDGFEFPLIDIAEAADNAPLVDALLGVERYALVVFVSPNAVDRAFAALAAARSDAPSSGAAADAPARAFSWPPAVPVAVVGPGTVRALARHGIRPPTHRIIAPGDAVRVALQAAPHDGGEAGDENARDRCGPPQPDDTPAMQVSSDSYSSVYAPRYDSEALIGAVAAAFTPQGLAALQGRHVLLVRGDGGRELLADTLRAHGAVVDACGAYQRLLPEPSFDAWQRVHALLAGQPHAWMLTSSEGVRNLEELAREHLNRDEIAALKCAPIVTPHPRIGEMARKAGFDTIRVSGAGDQAIVGTLRAVFLPVTQAASSPKTPSQSAQSRMTDSKDSQPASGAAPQAQSAHPAATRVLPNDLTPCEAKPRRRSVGTALAWTVAVVVLAGAGAGGYALERKIERLQQQLAARQQASDAQTRDTQLKAEEAASAARQLDLQLAQLTGRVSDVQTQQQALQALLQDLAKTRDDWTLAEVEQMISAASQQLQLTGNVGLALLALQSADTRLAASSGAQVMAVRKAIAHDIDKLKAAPSVDLAGLAIKLDDVVAQVDALPLAGETPVAPVKPHAGAPANAAAAENGEPRWKAWWHALASGVTQQLASLVQVRRIDHADAMLIAPEQGYLLRENVKLRLLSARISLLLRDEKLLNADLQATQRALDRYFDSSAQATRNAHELLEQVRKGAAHVELPNLDMSLTAIHQNKGRS